MTPDAQPQRRTAGEWWWATGDGIRCVMCGAPATRQATNGEIAAFYCDQHEPAGGASDSPGAILRAAAREMRQ